MQIGLSLIEGPKDGPHVASLTGEDFIVEVARYAEELGYDFISFSEHVVMPAEYTSRYPYQTYEGEEFKRYPWEFTSFPDPIVALSYVAAVTKRIKLQTNVLLVPERNPVVLAKELATLDALSGGRVEIGIGVGWLREEMEAVGVPWARRGKRTDEYLEAMRALWTQDEASYHGEFVSFDHIRLLPKPARPGGVRIVVGGHSNAAARRAGRLGDGFLPLGEHGGERWHFIEVMREAARAAGRDPDSITIHSGAGPNATIDTIKELQAQGVSYVTLPTMEATLEATKERMREQAERLFSHFK